MTDTTWLGPPIDVRPLFAGQQAAFIALLRGLSPGQFWAAADPDALGDGISWAGAMSAPAWLDAARDFSEYWTHHQQICDAIGEPGAGQEYLGPVLDTFMRALPYTLRHATAPAGAVLQMVVTGPSGGSWTCTRGPDRWRLRREQHPRPTARVELDPDIAWRLCTRGITPGHAAGLARVDGDRQLAATALQIVSIIWSPPGSGTSDT